MGVRLGSYGPGEPHIVTNIAVSSTLHAPPEYLEQLAEAIRRFARSRSAAEAASIRGRIKWVTRLNQFDGKAFDRRFGKTVAQRRQSG